MSEATYLHNELQASQGYKERPCLKNKRMDRNKFEEVKGMFLKTLKDDKEGTDKQIGCDIHELEV